MAFLSSVIRIWNFQNRNNRFTPCIKRIFPTFFALKCKNQVLCASRDSNDITTSEEQNSNPYHIQWFSLKDDTTDGVLAQLQFKVKEKAPDGEYPISISYNEDEIGNEKDELVHFETVNGSIKISKHIPGDVNGDGKVNLRDVIRLNQYVAGWKVTVVENSTDINGDGKVNLRDVIRLNQYVAGWKVEIQ